MLMRTRGGTTATSGFSSARVVKNTGDGILRAFSSRVEVITGGDWWRQKELSADQEAPRRSSGARSPRAFDSRKTAAAESDQISDTITLLPGNVSRMHHISH